MAEIATKPTETASAKKTKWRPSADESALLAETRKNLVKRAAVESGDELCAIVHAYERLLKLDRHG